MRASARLACDEHGAVVVFAFGQPELWLLPKDAREQVVDVEEGNYGNGSPEANHGHVELAAGSLIPVGRVWLTGGDVSVRNMPTMATQRILEGNEQGALETRWTVKAWNKETNIGGNNHKPQSAKAQSILCGTASGTESKLE